jgi:uncharacterized protein
MEYFVYCRDRPGTGALRRELTEAHWSFMDSYADRMIARGPTFAEDGATPTGSMHVVDLPDAEAARVFAFEEPNYRAGVYGEVTIRRFRNLLGRTMWDFAGDHGAEHFLVICRGGPEADDALREFATKEGGRVIVCGPLLSDDGSSRLGEAMALASPSRSAVEKLLGADRWLQAGGYDHVEIHRWRFGGRR